MSGPVLYKVKSLRFKHFQRILLVGVTMNGSGKTRLKKFEKPLKKLEIDTKNNVPSLDSQQLSPDGATFPNEQELRKITADWPVSRERGGRMAICNIAHEATAGP